MYGLVRVKCRLRRTLVSEPLPFFAVSRSSVPESPRPSWRPKRKGTLVGRISKDVSPLPGWISFRAQHDVGFKQAIWSHCETISQPITCKKRTVLIYVNKMHCCQWRVYLWHLKNMNIITEIQKRINKYLILNRSLCVTDNKKEDTAVSAVGIYWRHN